MVGRQVEYFVMVVVVFRDRSQRCRNWGFGLERWGFPSISSDRVALVRKGPSLSMRSHRKFEFSRGCH